MSEHDAHDWRLTRAVNAQRILEAVLRDGPVSRPQLARVTGLSKPTVSVLVKELESCDLLRPSGRAHGRVGRSPVLYEAHRHAGHVIGVDLGATKVHASLADLFGNRLADVEEPTRSGAGAVIGQIVDLCKRLPDDANQPPDLVQAVSVGVPGVVDPRSGVLSHVPNIEGFNGLALGDLLAEELGTAVAVENDVNLGALGELWRGAGNRYDSFVFLAIGTGTGMGVVLDRELYRGEDGAAGEIGYLPLGGDPWDPACRDRGAFEWAIAGGGVRRLCARLRAEHTDESGIPEGASAQEIFAAAAEGDRLGVAVVEEEARLVAMGIAAVTAVLSPRAVILGGGIGSNPLLVQPVRRWLATLGADRFEVETSSLHNLATTLGATTVALQLARARLLSRAAQTQEGPPHDT